MNLKNIEMAILIAIIFIALVLFVFRNTIKEKNKNAYYIPMAIIALVEIFIIIYFFFCYQLGLPASVTQDNSTDLTLAASDWLGFLGNYLGFSGSLVMAYLVYRQSDTINNLTISEYEPSISLIIQESVNSTEFKEKKDIFVLTNINQYIPGQKNNQYYSYHCTCLSTDIKCEEYSILIFVKIINNSKACIRNLSFQFLEIKELGSENVQFTFKKKDGTDPLDGYTDILPGRTLKRCFLIEKIPREIKPSWMTFYFSYRENLTFNPKILVSKAEGKSLFLLDASDTN